MNLIHNLLNHKIWLTIIVLVIILAGYFGYKTLKSKGTTLQYITSPITKGTLSVNVSGTGQVEASNKIDIKPQTDGRLTSVNVKENQKVKSGDVIAIVDQQSAANSVAQARASLQQAQASYDKLIDGATANTIATQQLSVTSAQQALDQAKQNYENVVTNQEQAVNKALNTLYNTGLSPEQSDAITTATLTLSGNYTGKNEGQFVINLYDTGNGLHYSVSGLGNESGAVNRGTIQPLGNGLYITFSTTGTLFSSTTWTIAIPNLKSSSYQSSLIAYNSAISSQTQALQSAQNSIDSAQNNLDKTNLAYENTIAPPTAADIASAKAQVTSAQAQLANAQTAYDNTILRAPFDGVIATLNYGVGDKITAGTAVATIITEQQLAKMALNEVDAAKVKVGQKATLTFSANPDLSVAGTVADVDNIGTVAQNVVNFNIKIALNTQDQSIKPGMSVSASVITNIRPDILMAPTAAIKTLGSQSYVEVLVNGKLEQKNVTAGLSNDTDTEISGDTIKVGDEVITQTITASGGSSASSGTGLLQSLLGGNRNRTTTTGGATSGTRSTTGATGGNAVFVSPGGSPPGGF